MHVAWQERSAGLWAAAIVLPAPIRIMAMPHSPKASRAAKLNETNADAPIPARALSKSAAVVGLLRREQGATLAELVQVTGWQPHTTRAMLTGLRKRGHAIDRGKRGDVTCYQLPVSAA